MPNQRSVDPYLDRLACVQEEVVGIDIRLSALEQGFVADEKQVDDFIEANRPKRPVHVEDLLGEAELARINIEYENALNKGVDCDVFDYALAAVCGVISGFIDVFFVSAPGNGVVDGGVDNLFESAVKVFAKRSGWKPRPGKENSLQSAIGFLEKNFKIGYDQATSVEIGNAIRHLSSKNHHAKSLGHYPDIFGLIASISNQFTDTSSFFDSTKGAIKVVRRTGNGVELKGNTTTAKIFSGFVNWLGHCMSDVSGSSGSQTRGQGLPIPFTEFFQLCNFGKFPNEKGAVAVFCYGYDESLRTGLRLTPRSCYNLSCYHQ